jgi:hypothetical protein
MKRTKLFQLLGALLVLMTITVACSGNEDEKGISNGENNNAAVEENEAGTKEPSSNGEAVTFKHMHGMGYTPDGEEIYVPAHDGFIIYRDGAWVIPDRPKHDYMGFSATDFGFYSSGHPEPGSNLKNPFGVIKSTYADEDFEKLDLYGKVDFHGMAAGFKSHAIYVLNAEKNSSMDGTGLFYTLDEAKTWEKAEVNGLEGQTASIAAHPTEAGTVAMGTNTGLFLSKDSGNAFTTIIENSPTTAIHFTNNGNLIAGTVTNESNYKAKLFTINLETKEKEEIMLPDLPEKDAISYIAVNPKEEQEIVFATYKNNMFISNDNGQSWNQIVTDGQGK